jgi:hypothetical protein
VVCVVFPLILLIWYAGLVVQHTDIGGLSLLQDGHDSIFETREHVCPVAIHGGKRLDRPSIQFPERFALVERIAGPSASTIWQPQVDDLHVGHSMWLANCHVIITNLNRGGRPWLIIRSEAIHPRVCSLEAVFERASAIAFDAAVARTEDHCCDAPVDVKVVEEIWILVEEGVGWVSSEVQCAAVVVRDVR